MDYSIRIPASDQRLQILEKTAQTKRELPPIKDYVFKPKGVLLSEFHPARICIRLREFVNGERTPSLDKIETKNTESGYTDTRENLGEGKLEVLSKKAAELGYEKWGVIEPHTVEYNLGFAQVLSQELSPIGTFLKIESETQDGLNKALQQMKAQESERIEKNAAVLLGEHLKLI